MTMELYFDTQEEAQEYYELLSEAYRDYPDYNIKILEKQVVYNYFAYDYDTYYSDYTYEDMVKEIKALGGWIIEGMEEE